MTAQATVTLACSAAPDEYVETEMTIVGGGICGILAAKGCRDRLWPYIVLDRNEELGGVWSTLANNHSYLQAYEPNYRWDARYRLSQDELTKGSGLAVHHGLKQFAYDHAIDRFTRFSTEVVTIKQRPDGSFLTVCKHTKSGKVTHIRSQFLIVTPGILSTQYMPEERGVKDVNKFKGVACMGGRHNGVHSAVGHTDLTGKRVVIMGTGSFALEAMEAAGRNNAAHITLVSRPRKRWVFPFSRQYTLAALAAFPLLPWSIKARLSQWYMRKNFFEPVGLAHYPPTGSMDDQDWSGQCNDGLFRLSAEGRLTVKLGKVDRLESSSVVLEGGEKLPADVYVCAAGCKYNLNPSFMSELGVGFGDIHNFCFMGRNPRIGTASDFVYAYVPLGPQIQLMMYFHAVEQIKAGREKAVLNAMFPTPLGATGLTNHTGGRMAGHHTWWSYRSVFSAKNIAMEERNRALVSVLDVGRSFVGRLGLRAVLAANDWKAFFTFMRRSVRELTIYPRVWGKGAVDYYHPKHALCRAKAE